MNNSGGNDSWEDPDAHPSGQSQDPYAQSAESFGTPQAQDPFGQDPFAQSPQGPAPSAADLYGQAGPQAQQPDPHGQPDPYTPSSGNAASSGPSASDPYGQSAGPYGQPADRYGRPDLPYGQASPGYGQHFTGHAPAGGAQPPAGELGQSRLVVGLLGIFLGAFGVHRFLLGHTTIGIIQVCITVLSCGTLSWVSGIWGMIEGILVLTRSEQFQHDAHGRPLAD